MVLEPVDQVVDVVVAHPLVVVQCELPQEVEVLQHAVLEVLEAVVGQVQLAEVQQSCESGWKRGGKKSRVKISWNSGVCLFHIDEKTHNIFLVYHQLPSETFFARNKSESRKCDSS